jgi:MarR family transcriptional regulator for hemolysin
MLQKLDSVIFYYIEKAIKSYRQFAQKELKKAGLKITVDQWLTLNCINEHPEISQKELAEMVFKDTASVTRIVELLVQAGYLKRAMHGSDGRRAILQMTRQGKNLLEKAAKIVSAYREQAQEGIATKDIEKAKQVMAAIIDNCK